MSVPLVAHVIYRLHVGGLENGLANLIERIPRSQYRHAIISLTDYTSFRERIADDVPIIAINKAPGNDLSMFPRLWRTFRSLRPDIVHSRNLAALEAQVPAFLAGVSGRVHGEHGWDVFDPDGLNRKYQRLRRVMNPLLHRFIPLSGHLEGYLRDRVKIPKDKIRQIYNGVDTTRFRPRGADECASMVARWDADCVTIGTVGRMEAVKDQLTLTKAFVRLRQISGLARSKARLALIGDGSLRKACEEVLREAQVAEYAWVPGTRDDVETLMRGLDIFVLPSLAEGISNTILEAMATGIPVIATDVGGNPELVGPESGHLVRAADPEALAQALKSYVEDPSLRRRQGEAGRARVQEKFSMERMVASYVGVYDEVLGHVRPA